VPRATGWAAERICDGEINVVACLENRETSTVGRAIANPGYTGTRQRPSAEKMAKSSCARARLVLERPESRAVVNSVCEPMVGPSGGEFSRSLGREEQPTLVRDLLSPLERAEFLGVRTMRVQRWRHVLNAGLPSTADLTRCERRLRLWIEGHRRRLPR
jgi:hypothetical protein